MREVCLDFGLSRGGRTHSRRRDPPYWPLVRELLTHLDGSTGGLPTPVALREERHSGSSPGVDRRAGEGAERCCREAAGAASTSSSGVCSEFVPVSRGRDRAGATIASAP